MPFEVPKSKASIKQNRFEFTLPGSKRVHSVPLLKYLPISVMRAASDDEFGAILAAFDHADAATGEAVRALDAEQIQALMEAWSEASGVSMGESSASPTS